MNLRVNKVIMTIFLVLAVMGWTAALAAGATTYAIYGGFCTFLAGVNYYANVVIHEKEKA